jgi:hypothetical protein
MSPAIYQEPAAATVTTATAAAMTGRHTRSLSIAMHRRRALGDTGPVRGHSARACVAAAVSSAALGLGLPGPIHAAGSVPSFAGCSAAAPQIRPTSILVACGDGNFFLTKIKWSKWNETSAAAIATGHQNDCKPSCADGHFSLYQVAVVLSRPRTCRNGRHEFTRFTFRFVSRKPPGVLRGGTFKSPFYRGSGCP